MAEKDSASTRQRHFVNDILKDFYHKDELIDVFSEDESVMLASDALVGLVAAHTEWDPEFLVDYLSDVPQNNLRSEYPEFSPKGSGGGEWKVSLQAARVGREAILQAGIPTLVERKPFILEKDGPLPEEDLHSTIITLYENNLINSTYAQGLLLLFEQAESSAEGKIQASVRTQTRTRLKKDISLNRQFSDTKLSRNIQSSLAVLNLILKVNMKQPEDRGPSYRTMSEVIDMYADENKHMSRQDVQRRIEEYLTYGLITIYAK